MTERATTPVTELRWDFVADPPTRLLAELDLARTRLRRRKLEDARRAAVRLLRHVDAEPTPGLEGPVPQRLAAIRADGLAVQAITSMQLGRDDGPEILRASLETYEALQSDGLGLRPSGLAGYGMVLALAGRHGDAVAPLARAAEAGEDVSMQLVVEAAQHLGEGGETGRAVQLLRAVHERYPNEPLLAAELARAFHEVGNAAEEAAAHVDAGALLADADRFDEALGHFAMAANAFPNHPLAALGHCQALLALGRVGEALEQLDELRRMQPNLAGAHVVTALGLAQLGRRDEALATLDGALARFTDDLWLLDTRIRLLLSAGRTGDAIAAVDKALEVDPTDRTWRGLRAEMRIGIGENVDVELQVLRELATASPGWIEPAVRLARALRTSGRNEEALDVVTRAGEEHPEAPEVLGLEVELLSELGRAPDAVRKARRALDTGVALVALALPLARALLATGQVTDANEIADQAVAADPESPRARGTRGLARYRAGRYEEAIGELEAGLADPELEREVRPALAASLAAIGVARYQVGELDGARPILERAVDVDPTCFEARQWLSETFRMQRQYVKALEHANFGLELQPDNAWLIGTRGQIQEALEDDEGAEGDLRRAIELDPQLGWARSELGDFLRVRRRFHEALVELDRAIKISPDDAWPWACKGAAEYALDRYDDAVASLSRSLRLNESYAWAQAALSTTLADVDELAAAREHIERALQLDPTMRRAWGHLGWLELLEVFDEHGRVRDPDAPRRALQAYRSGLEHDPDGAVDELFGEACLLAGQVDDAMTVFRQVAGDVRRNERPDANQLMTLGWCELRMGSHGEAIDALVSAIALDTAHVSVAFDLALTLLCAGRVDVALEEYTQAMARARSVLHRGRQRLLVRVAQRDLSSLATDQLRDRPADVAAARALLDDHGGGDGTDGAGGLLLS